MVLKPKHVILRNVAERSTLVLEVQRANGSETLLNKYVVIGWPGFRILRLKGYLGQSAVIPTHDFQEH